MIYTAHYTSPLGGITLASDGMALTGLYFDDEKDCPPKTRTHRKARPLFRTVKAWLDLYFSETEPDFMPPLAPAGTTFQQAVWEILKTIPYGETTTYGAIAKQLEKNTGRHMSAQAVGGAVGRNPISILIPCHRVIGANGSLTGYAGGLDKKEYLLELEGVIE